MNKKKLTEYITQDFHNANFEVYTTALDLHFDFLNEGDIVVVNANDFPDVHITIETIKEAAILIPEDSFFEYMSLAVSCPKLLVYVATGIRPMYFSPDAVKATKATENIHKSIDTVTPYIKAYESGLLKTAYLKARETDEHVVFAIINAEAKLLTVEDAEEYVEKQFPEDDVAVEVYFDYILDKDVSVLYINEKEGHFWYEVLHEDYEKMLFDKWHY